MRKLLTFVLTFFVYTIIITPVFLASQAHSETITLRMPTYKDNSHIYYFDLISKSLQLIDVTLKINSPDKFIPHKRAVFMFEHNNLDAIWMIQTKERDKQFSSPGVGLTNGLAGQRVFFIPKNSQKIYNQIESIEDFRQLNISGAMGIDWFDVKIWQHNNLKCTPVDGNWERIYKFVGKRAENYEYFARGVNEIVSEAKNHPYLDVEERLLFIYDRDFQIYLGANTGKYTKIIRKALLMAKKSGLMNSLIQKHWPDAVSKMDLKHRVKIHLNLPDN